MKKNYNKLVRDRIPEICKRQGISCETRILDEEEYRKGLLDKIVEEAQEVAENPSCEELADVMEVVESIAKTEGFSLQNVLEIKEQKRLERGGFEKKIKLISTDEN